MINHYLFECQRLVSLRKQPAGRSMANSALIATGLLMFVTAGWFGHCTVSGCELLG